MLKFFIIHLAHQLYGPYSKEFQAFYAKLRH